VVSESYSKIEMGHFPLTNQLLYIVSTHGIILYIVSKYTWHYTLYSKCTHGILSVLDITIALVDNVREKQAGNEALHSNYFLPV
jgi:hypothetical protein